MSKARTLANLISDNAELADGQISVAEVVGAAPTASPTFTGVVGATTISSPTLNATINLKTTDANGEGIGLGIDADKKVRFYDDQGASTKMYWNASTATQKFEDSSKIAFGSSEDLKIYHDGSSNHTFITETGSGHLYVRADNLKLQSAGGDNYAQGIEGAGFFLYHDDIEKLKTTTTGIDVTGTATSDALDLTAIAKDISDTAVDVFVYDTSKDSDGGAWRKRTQHTSWYNEAASSTRGSRKEFPAVAVIVAESNQVTIYDGDDPDLPMWMVFNQGNQYQIYTNDNNLSSIQMLNGKLCWAGFRIGRIDFIKDASDALELSYYVKFTNPISGRNTANYSYEASAFSIVNNSTNDVAMTVLPNAPIDDATGLPVPTIAVATNGGVSVIKDDGTVVDLTYTANATNESGSVNFTEGNGVAWTTRNISGTYAYLQHLHTIPSSDYSSAPDNIYYRDVNAVPGYIGTYVSKLLSIPNGYAVSSTAALTIFDENKDLTSTGMNAYITSDYNTGWMNGDIKLATLSDTDDTDVTGSQYISNSEFTSNITGWTNLGSVTLTHATDSLSVVNSSGAYHNFNGSFSTSTGSGEVGVLVVKLKTINSFPFLGLRFYKDSSNLIEIANTTNEQAFTTSMYGTNEIRLRTRDGLDVEIDYIRFYRMEEDRSVNGNGLQVFGSITKDPVNTGADLVGYGGFNSSNYLIQPYNSDLDFGTGDFSFIFWLKEGTFYTNHYVFDRSDNSENNRYALYINQNHQPAFFVAGGTSFVGTSTTVPENVWACVLLTRRNGVIYCYVNGEQTDYAAFPDSLTMSNTPELRIGNYYGGGALVLDNLALFRASATSPSAEQIKKIYEDEKHLFQENAKATLYGTSDAVTALAHDDTTDLLHVGTSAGRSVFQGLRRVDNTTDAVGAAISASNGLVAED